MIGDFPTVNRFKTPQMNFKKISIQKVVRYTLNNQARGQYEEIFVLTFKAYGPNEVRFMRLECQNKYFLCGPKSRLISAMVQQRNNLKTEHLLPWGILNSSFQLYHSNLNISPIKTER